MTNYLDFEKPLAEIEGKAEELRAMARQSEGMDIESEAAALDKKAADMLVALYKELTPWQNAKWRGTQTAHIALIISKRCLQNTPLSQATGTLPTMTP